ncbi:MAG: hypothetical protein NT022_03635 [Deltaproteobacteria bacterium]|nr:hypothetical protein [Deltaproteobacteria bacterium]
MDEFRGLEKFSEGRPYFEITQITLAAADGTVLDRISRQYSHMTTCITGG